MRRPAGHRNARGLATARRIGRAAVRLAGERGLEGLTVDMVCEAVGVSQRTFFHHFATKEDALLGLELPELDEDAARRYLSDPDVPVLAGAIGLVRLPADLADDPAAAVAKLGLIVSSPVLAQRQAERMTPLLHEVRSLVLLKLRAVAAASGGTTDEAELDRQADLVTALGGALVQRIGMAAVASPGAPPEDPERLLATLRPIWSRLV